MFNSLVIYHGFFLLNFTRDMLKYTESVRTWMSADPKNIIAIHCKGGKGEKWILLVWLSWSWLCLSVFIPTVYHPAVPQGALEPWCAHGSLTVTSLRVQRLVSELFKAGLMNEVNILNTEPLPIVCVCLCIRTAWSILVRGGQTRVRAPSFREWRLPLRWEHQEMFIWCIYLNWTWFKGFYKNLAFLFHAWITFPCVGYKKWQMNIHFPHLIVSGLLVFLIWCSQHIKCFQLIFFICLELFAILFFISKSCQGAHLHHFKIYFKLQNSRKFWRVSFLLSMSN